MSTISAKREKKKRNQIKYASEASFKSYIREVLHMIDRNGHASISEQSLEIINTLIHDMFGDLATQAKHMMVTAGKRTLTAWDMQAAVLECLTGEVARHAICEGQKAMSMFQDMTKKKKK